MQFKKYYVIIPMLLIIVVLIACSKKDAEVVVNSYVKADTKSKKDGLSNDYFNPEHKKINTTSATDKIRFVDKENKDFWNAIKYNYIDSEYNNTKIKIDNIRIYKKVNIKYADQWVEELSKTYKYITTEVCEDLDAEIEAQYKGFMDYYDSSRAMYFGILVPKNNYNGKIDGFDSVRQFYALAEDVREYTILLKEYIYIETGKVEFYSDEDIKVESDRHKNVKKTIKPLIVDDEQFADIIIDNYNNNISCEINDLTRTKASKKADQYRDFWLKEFDTNYKKLEDVFNKEDRKILKIQKDGYSKYVKASRKIQKKILEDSNVIDLNYNKNIDIENVIFHGQAYMRYNTLMMEYYYLLTEKIDL